MKKSAAPETPGNRAMIKLLRMLVKGIEPPAYALRVRCSTPELHQLTAFSVKQNTLYIVWRKTQPFLSQPLTISAVARIY